MGCGITISKCSGSGDKDVAARIFTRIIIALIAVSIALSVALFFAIEPLLQFMHATPENIVFAREYLTVLLLGSVPMILFLAGDYILTNDNDPGLVLLANIVSATVNIVGNVVGMEVLHLHHGACAGAMVLGNLC